MEQVRTIDPGAVLSVHITVKCMPAVLFLSVEGTCDGSVILAGGAVHCSDDFLVMIVHNIYNVGLTVYIDGITLTLGLYRLSYEQAGT